MSQYGFVYVLGNEAMPNLYKVGCTERSPSLRADELSRATGVAAPFQLLAYGEFTDALITEAELHRYFADIRFNPGREFFWGPVDQLIEWITHSDCLSYSISDGWLAIYRKLEALYRIPIQPTLAQVIPIKK